MRPKITIPRALLERAAAEGWTLRDIQRDLRDIGVVVSLHTVRDRVAEAGLILEGQYDPMTPEKFARRRERVLAERRYHQPRRRVGKVEGKAIHARRGDALSSEEDLTIMRAISERERARLDKQGKLAKRARLGYLRARLLCLRRYGCLVWTHEEIAREDARRKGLVAGRGVAA